MVFHREERGQGMVEYALILLLIAIVVIAALTIFGEQLSAVYSKISYNIAWLH